MLPLVKYALGNLKMTNTDLNSKHYYTRQNLAKWVGKKKLILRLKLQIVFERGHLSQQSLRAIKQIVVCPTLSSREPFTEFWDAEEAFRQVLHYFSEWPEQLSFIQEKRIMLSAFGGAFSYLQKVWRKLFSAEILKAESMRWHHATEKFYGVQSLLSSQTPCFGRPIFEKLGNNSKRPRWREGNFDRVFGSLYDSIWQKVTLDNISQVWQDSFGNGFAIHSSIPLKLMSGWMQWRLWWDTQRQDEF